MGCNSDPLVVRTRDVYLMLQPLIEAWDREAEGHDGQHFGGWAGIANLVGVTPRRVKAALLQQAWMGFGRADEWLTAVGLHVRGLKVYPNPQWSLERWVEWNEKNGGCVG
jgi:hypothetical protein